MNAFPAWIFLALLNVYDNCEGIIVLPLNICSAVKLFTGNTGEK